MKMVVKRTARGTDDPHARTLGYAHTRLSFLKLESFTIKDTMRQGYLRPTMATAAAWG